MFEVGFTEIILILGIALVVLGPEKLPKVAAEIGRWLGRARAMARQLKVSTARLRPASPIRRRRSASRIRRLMGSARFLANSAGSFD